MYICYRTLNNQFFITLLMLDREEGFYKEQIAQEIRRVADLEENQDYKPRPNFNRDAIIKQFCLMGRNGL